MLKRDWPVAPLILLGFSLAGALVLVSLAPGFYRPETVPWFVALTLVAAAARWLLASQTPRSARSRFAFWGNAAVVVPLVLLNPLFGLYAFYGYEDSQRHLRGREATAGVVATAVVCAVSQTGGPPSALFTPLFLALFLTVNLTIAVTMGCADKARRQRADELQRTNDELVRSQEANAALQAELVHQARDTGVAQERARLAREIHDTVAQDLVAIIAQLAAVSSTDDGTERERRLELVDETARKALAEARRAVRALSSPRLDEADLPSALGDLLMAWRQAEGGEARLIVDGDARPSANDPALLRITQEALSNARKHAHAGNVQIELGYEDDHVRVTIADDGAGFEPSSTRSGVGLPGMRGRAAEADGDVTVDSAPGRGTIVTATLPGRWR